MPAELGQTEDPRALVPGSPEAITADLRALATAMTSVEGAGDGLRRVDHPVGWKGQASDAFGEAFGVEPPKWMRAVEDLDGGGTAVAGYADVLNWAQGRAQQAIELYAQGEAASQAAAARYMALAALPGAALLGPFVDPGSKLRQEAQAILADARGKKESSGTDAAAALEVTAGQREFTAGRGYRRSASRGSTAGAFPLKGLLAEFGIDVPTHTASVGGGVSVLSGKLNGGFDAGPLSGSGTLSGSVLGADGSAHASWSKLGVTAGAGGEAYLAKGSTSGKVRLGEHVGVGASGRAFLGTKAGANGHIGATGVSGHAGAFAGGRLSGGVHADVGGVTAGVNGSVQYGVGAHVDGQFGMGNDGKFHIGFEAGATLGVGGSVGFDVAIDPGEVVDTAKDLAHGAEEVGEDIAHGAEDAWHAVTPW